MKRYLYFFTNKYLLVLVLFFVWIIFFDQNNLIYRLQNEIELYSLKQDKQYYEEEIKNTHQMKEELFSNEEKLEKFAREKYKMKKDDEEIFIILPDED